MFKEGAGNLGLDGEVNSISLDGKIVINAGTLSLLSEYVLASTSDVVVTENAELALVSGDQAINALGGLGTIDLGDNTLDVNDGGEFEGIVEGNGTININGGDFSVTSNFMSESGSFEVNDQAMTKVTSDAMLAFPQVSVQSGGELEVAGDIVAAEQFVVEENATLDGSNGMVHTPTADIYGTVAGNAGITGSTTVYDTGRLAPGNSPGTLSFEDLNLLSGSMVSMEIEQNGLAGVDFNRINVAKNLFIENSANLEILKLSSELAAGEQVKIFNFGEGNINGYFGQISSDYANNLILNLATGTVASLGDVTNAEFVQAVSGDSSEVQILSDLTMPNTGNVTQYYGGNLVTALNTAYTNGTDTSAVFGQFSPRHYSALAEQSRALAVNSLSDLSFDGATEQHYVDVRFDDHTIDSQSNATWDKFKVSNHSLALSFVSQTQDYKIVTTMRSDNLQSISNALTSEGEGYTLGFAVTNPIGENGFTARYNIISTNHNYDTNRKTLNGIAEVDNVVAKTQLFGIGVGYQNNFDGYKFNASIDHLYYSTVVNGFTESNPDSVLDALTVSKSTDKDSLRVVRFGLVKNLTNDLRMGVKVGHYKFANDSSPVLARVAVEDIDFMDTHSGIGNGLYDVQFEMQYQVHNSFHLGLSLESLDNKFAQDFDSFSLNMSYTF